MLKITDPQEFVAKFYSSILLVTHNNLEIEQKFARLFFTPDLLREYKLVQEIDKKTTEVGCLNDFDNFTGIQEDFLGFWVGKTITHSNENNVPVYLNLNGVVFDPRKPDIILHLIKSGSGLKIKDIEYKFDASYKSLRTLLKECLKKQSYYY